MRLAYHMRYGREGRKTANLQLFQTQKLLSPCTMSSHVTEHIWVGLTGITVRHRVHAWKVRCKAEPRWACKGSSLLALLVSKALRPVYKSLLQEPLHAGSAAADC